MNPTADGLGFTSSRTASALDEFTTIFRIGEIADIVTKDAPVFVNLYYVAVAILANRTALDDLGVAGNVILIDCQSRTTGGDRECRRRTPCGEIVADRPDNRSGNGDDDRSAWCL